MRDGLARFQQTLMYDALLMPAAVPSLTCLLRTFVLQLKLNDQILAEEKHVPMYKVYKWRDAAGSG
jgi:hypothetical protein